MKNELRLKYKALRSSFTSEQLESKSLKIFLNTIFHFNLNHKKISVFLPIDRFNEINTWHFLNKVDADFYLPVMNNDELKHVLFENEAQLEKNDWGILEPKHGEEIEANKLDIVIVPLLAFNEEGHRIGYGKGFYDKFLKKCKPGCQFVGISYFEFETSQFEINEFDIPIDFCITPNNFYAFKK